VPSDEVLDPAVVAALRRAQDAFGNPGFIRQLAALFLATTPGKMDRLREAFTAGDAAAIREVAHALKSNCGMLGATRMADACALMEDAAARADLAAAAGAFREAEQQLTAVLEALAALD
jgi:HPt (histidine-containing phosphotransfer) domain-containing protein